MTFKIPGDVDVAPKTSCSWWVGLETAGAGWHINTGTDNGTVIDAEISGRPLCKTSARKKANVSLA